MKTLTVQLELVKALPEDLKQISGFDGQSYTYGIKQGQVFFLMSQLIEKLEGPYILNNDTDTKTLANYLKNEMIYIPVNNFESRIPVINTNQLEHARTTKTI